MKSLFAGKSRKAVAIFVSVAAAAAITTVSFAGDGDKGGGGAPPPGVPYTGDAVDGSQPVGSDQFEPIVTSGSTYDSTILTKSMSALAFMPHLGTQTTSYASSACISPLSNDTQLDAQLELPDGARIKQLIAFGRDNYAPAAMNFYLYRLSETQSGIFSLGAPTRTPGAIVTSFSSTDSTSEFALASTDNLNEVTGTISTFTAFPFFSSTLEHRFHEVFVTMTAAAGVDHVFCGIEVLYQVPAVASGGTAFYPISPVRAFDSRIAAYTPLNGLLAPNTSRVIPIKDGHDSAGAVNLVDAVPAGATAVTYNITVTGTTGPNFLAVTPGDAGSFTASAINFTAAGASLANAATVSIASDRTIKIWGGDQSGSTHVIIDITGYYAPLPNMGN